MTAPKLATTRPAALTGTIGQGGLNRPHDVALVQNEDEVRGTDRAHPMGNQKRRSVGQYRGQAALDRLFRFRIEGIRGLVKNENPRVVIERPGNRDPLALSAR